MYSVSDSGIAQRYIISPARYDVAQLLMVHRFSCLLVGALEGSNSFDPVVPNRLHFSYSTSLRPILRISPQYIDIQFFLSDNPKILSVSIHHQPWHGYHTSGSRHFAKETPMSHSTPSCQGRAHWQQCQAWSPTQDSILSSLSNSHATIDSTALSSQGEQLSDRPAQASPLTPPSKEVSTHL